MKIYESLVTKVFDIAFQANAFGVAEGFLVEGLYRVLINICEILFAL